MAIQQIRALAKNIALRRARNDEASDLRKKAKETMKLGEHSTREAAGQGLEAIERMCPGIGTNVR